MNCTQRPPVEQSENHEIIGTVLTDLNQNPIELADLKGKTVFLNFWATWCKPCIAEMPSIENARKILAADSIVFLLASNESLDKIQKFKQKKSFDLNFVQLTSPLENLGIMAFPTTHIIAPSGETVFSEMGGREWDSEENLEMIRKINEEK
ncbi:MAG: redoxin domain-containing protein [Bacteroidota bacterium]